MGLCYCASLVFALLGRPLEISNRSVDSFEDLGFSGCP